MPRATIIDVLAVLFVAAIGLFTLACLLFPKLYLRIQRRIRPSELHFENERPDRERQLAMVTILVFCAIMLVEMVHCGR